MIAVQDDDIREAVARSLQRIARQDARRYVQLANPLPLWRGGKLRGAQIAYECWGELNEARNNAILLFTGLSTSAHARSSSVDPVEGWWERMIGPGLAIDTERFFVVCVNSLGSCFGSTGPRSNNPATGEPYRLSFPELSVEDVARGGYEVQRALGIERLCAVVGPSMGGMTVLAFAAQFPGAARGLISISGTTAASAFAIGLRSIQREAVRSDPHWQGGQYSFYRPPIAGLRLARKLGTITYRSAEELNERFGRDPIKTWMRGTEAFGPEFAVEHYLGRLAERFVNTFDANCYLYLSRAMDRFDLAEHGDGITQVALDSCALERALVIGVESDMLFTIGEQFAVAEALRTGGTQTRFASLQCLQGHDSFLIEIEQFGREIRDFLERL